MEETWRPNCNKAEEIEELLRNDLLLRINSGFKLNKEIEKYCLADKYDFSEFLKKEN